MPIPPAKGHIVSECKQVGSQIAENLCGLRHIAHSIVEGTGIPQSAKGPQDIFDIDQYFIAILESRSDLFRGYPVLAG